MSERVNDNSIDSGITRGLGDSYNDKRYGTYKTGKGIYRPLDKEMQEFRNDFYNGTHFSKHYLNNI